MSNTKVYCDGVSVLILIEENVSINGIEQLRISGQLFFDGKSFYLDKFEGSFDDVVKLFISYIYVEEDKKLFGYDIFNNVKLCEGDKVDKFGWIYSKFELINEDDFYILYNSKFQRIKSSIKLIESWSKYSDYVNFLKKVNSFSGNIH